MTSDLPPEKRSAALLQERVRRVFQELPGALAGGEEPVHQLRVTTRRLRVALPLLAREGDGRRLRRVLRVLRQLTRAVAPARDLDVLAGLLEDHLAALGATAPEQRTLLGRLRADRSRTRRQLAEALLDLDIDGLRRGLRRLLRPGPADPGTALARALTYREAQAAALLRGFSQVGDRFLPDALHALRRRVRRLRYAAEVEDVVRGEGCRAPALWKRLQEAIGAIHDRQVLAHWLDEQARSAETRGRAPLARAARRERRFVIGEARKLHAAFLETRPADLALRALEASARRRGRLGAVAPDAGSASGWNGEGRIDAARDHPPRDRGATRDAGDPR